MRPPISYVPLLPWATLLIAVIAALKYFGLLDPATPALYDRKASYTGRVCEAVESEKGYSLTVKLLDSLSTGFKARLTVASTGSRFEEGDSVTIHAKLAYPVYDDSSPDAFDYPGYLKSEGITATGYVTGSNIEITAKNSSLLTRIKGMRRHCITLLKRSALSQESALFLATALLGDESSLPDDTRQTFVDAGQAHILALSGMHVGIIAFTLSILTIPLILLRKRSARLILTVILLWGYAVLTGLSPSVLRAVIMATCLYGGYILQRHHLSANALLLAAIIILAASPTQLFDAGFQMSFLAVGCILLFMPSGRMHGRLKNKVLRPLLAAAYMSVCATAGAGMLSAYYFHSFPVYFLPANIPTALLLPPIMGGGILLIILEHFGCDPAWLCHIIDQIYNIAYNYAELIGSLPKAVIRNLYIPSITITAYYMCLLAIALCLRIRNRWTYGLAAASVLASTIIIPMSTIADRPECEYFIPRDSRHVSIIYYDGDKASIIAFAPHQIASDLKDRSITRHRDFLGRRGLDSLSLITDSATLPGVILNKNFIDIHGTRYLMVDSDTCLSGKYICSPGYAVVCNGFKGNVIDVANLLKPDTILLSANLHIRRHDRYADSLTTHGIPFRSLKHTAHRIRIR